MRWTCLALFAVVVALSTLGYSQTTGPTPKATDNAARLYLPAQGLEFSSEPPLPRSMLGHIEVRVLELQGTGISPVPEPSSMAFFGLLATPFLLRRRRLQVR